MLLDEALDQEPQLSDIRAALDAMLPEWRMPPADNPAGLRQRVASRAP
jgi:hypothetical protein